MFGDLRIFQYLCSVKINSCGTDVAAVHRNVAAIFVSKP